MSDFRFIHAADLHLDSPFRGMSHVPDAIRERLRASTFTAFTNLIDLALREQVDFVVCSGDVYDSADRSLRAQLRLQRELQRLAAAHIPVYIIHGNHDPEDGMHAELTWPDTVHFLSAQEVETKIVYRRGQTDASKAEAIAAVCGISYAHKALHENVAVTYQRLAGSSLYHIGLLHGNVDGDPGHDNYAPCSKRELIQSGMDYWALGHIHIRQILHEQEPCIVYPGNIQGRSVKEAGAKGCYIVQVTEERQTHLTFVPLDDVRWYSESISIEGLHSEQGLKERVVQQMEQCRQASQGRMSILRLTLNGRGALHRKLEQSSFVQDLLQVLREEESYDASEDAETGDIVWLESLLVDSGAEVDVEHILEQESFLGELFRMAGQATLEQDLYEEIVDQALESMQGHARLRLLIEELKDSDEGRKLIGRARELAAVLLEEDDPRAGGEAS
ncbi:metallophosphoesterase family protein [Paenibacillus guangzhouensis]|uniref:metallophosphoesterase family protein n=1 Tax=Paenibacillus guangzhouensis TaxID=1473112 RepID=UPI001266F072|nr:DNA repair exonuclease [Paenibacillus guangzhouensis]